MTPTHKVKGENMISDSRESFLCGILNCGGKALRDEAMAFSKKFV
jgi:hypothetical protein